MSSRELRTLRDKNFNKQLTFPLVEDIKLFNEYLEKYIKICIEHIKNIAGNEKLLQLSRLTLCLLIVFNRRRAGEVQRIKLTDIADIKRGDVPLEILETLSSFERKLTASLYRFEIIGKRNRHVTVLLTDLMRDTVIILSKTVSRKTMNIIPKNEHLFARPNSDFGTLRATVLF